jgi:hypothetical protein
MKTGPEIVDAALSDYNSGNFVAGIRNGYVARYDTSGGIDDVMARSGAVITAEAGQADTVAADTVAPRQWALVAAETVIRGPIRLRKSDFSFSPQAAISLWGIDRLPPATRIALREYLYPSPGAASAPQQP